MTVFCITLFRMCTICVSRLWRAEIPHFICSWSLFVRLSRPSYFGMSKQSCRKAGFYILLWSFHGEVVIPRGGKKRKRFQLCLLPALRLLCTSRLHLLAMLALYCSALTRSRMERSHCSRENKRLWSALQRPSLTPRPSPFRQLYATGKTNIEFFFSPCCRKHPHHHRQITFFFPRKRQRKKTHFNKYSSPQNPLDSILAYSFIACFWFVASSIIALPLTKQRACLRACLLEPHAEWYPSDSCTRHLNLTTTLQLRVY